MSGRNNRIVRNREKNSGFSWNSKVLKMVGSIFVIILIMTVIMLLVLKAKNNKNTVNIVELDGNISYEYFILSAENGIGVIDKKGNQILETKYTRCGYSKSIERCIYRLHRRGK